MHEKIYRGRAIRWILVTVLVALLSGCGGDDDKSAKNPSPGGSAPPPSTPAPAPGPSPVPPPVQSRTATLEWTAPTTQTNGSTLADLAGYRIHYGKSARELDQVIEVRNPSVSSYVIEGLAPGTYYFAVSAFNSRNFESERSNAGKKDIT